MVYEETLVGLVPRVGKPIKCLSIVRVRYGASVSKVRKPRRLHQRE